MLVDVKYKEDQKRRFNGRGTIPRAHTTDRRRINLQSENQL